MKELLLSVLHLAVMTAKLCGPGGVRAVMAEIFLLKQQLIVLRRGSPAGAEPSAEGENFLIMCCSGMPVDPLNGKFADFQAYYKRHGGTRRWRATRRRLRRRSDGRPCRVDQCALGLPLPGFVLLQWPPDDEFETHRLWAGKHCARQISRGRRCSPSGSLSDSFG